MIALMAFATVVSVTQLTVLGSWARTLRWTTLLQAVAAGFLVCGPVTVAIQWVLTRGVALASGRSVAQVVSFAAWTFDPLIEELVKVFPLALLAWLLPRIHRQFGWVDQLLTGAALGAGFALCEAALRYSRLGFIAMPTGDGFIVAGGFFGIVVVPSLWHSLFTWQPQPAMVQDLLSSSAGGIQHLTWTALAAVGLAWLSRATALRWLGLIPLLVVTLDHCYSNADATFVPGLWLATPLKWIGPALPTLLVLTLVAVIAIDRRQLARTRAAHPELLLAGEHPSGLDPRPMARVALLQFPWSTFSTWHVVLERRAALNALAADVAPPELAHTSAASIALLGRATDAERWATAGRTLLARVDWRALRSWRMILLLASTLPAVAFLIIGAFPATKALQAWMSGTAGAWLMASCLVGGGILICAQLPELVRQLRAATEPIRHETRVRPALRLVTSASVLVCASALLTLLAIRHDPDLRILTNAHILDALSNATLMLGLAILLLSFLLFPPGAALLVTTAGTVVLTGSGAALLAGTALGGTLIAQGLLQMASGEGSSGSGSSSSGSGSTGAPKPTKADWERSSVESGRFTEADLPRLRDLAKDPAHGGSTSKGTWGEAEVGLGLEKKGSVQGLQRSQHPGEEFVDRARQGWDVKAFRGDHFDLKQAMDNMGKKIRGGINVMMDTRNLSAEQFLELNDAVRKAGWASKVLWWP